MEEKEREKEEAATFWSQFPHLFFWEGESRAPLQFAKKKSLSSFLIYYCEWGKDLTHGNKFQVVLSSAVLRGYWVSVDKRIFDYSTQYSSNLYALKWHFSPLFGEWV